MRILLFVIGLILILVGAFILFTDGPGESTLVQLSQSLVPL